MYGNPPREPQRLLLTTKEAAKALSCCERTIKNMAARGDLNLVRLGPSRRAVRVDVRDLEKLIENLKGGGR